MNDSQPTPLRDDFIYTYGAWMSYRSSPEAAREITALIDGDQRISMLEAVSASGYSAGTVAKVLLRLGYLMLDEGKGLVTSNWERATDQEREATRFRKMNSNRRLSHSLAEPDEEPEPEPEEFPGWKVSTPDEGITVGELRRICASAGIDLRILSRVK